jgi:hypothetical protein
LETEAELQLAKVKLKERVGKMEAEVREREARLATAELKWELQNAALASSNTELLRYKRACVCLYVYVWMGRPTHGLAPCLNSPTSPARICTYAYLPSLYRPADDPQRD